MKRSAIALLGLVIFMGSLYAALAQVSEKAAEKVASPGLADGAIVVQPPMPEIAGPTGRYQMKPYNTNGSWGVVVIDTQTGQVWVRERHSRWQDWGSPVGSD